MKKRHIHIAIFILLIVVLILVEYMKPIPVNWHPTFARRNKIPYGTYVLYDLLPDIFPSQDIEENRLSLYEFFLYKDSGNYNFIFINYNFHPDIIDTKQLLNTVSEGSSVFIAANNINRELADTLNITTDYENFSLVKGISSDSARLIFVNPNLASDTGYIYDKAFYAHFFTSFDTAAATVLGKTGTDKINYIKTDFGKGSFYINLAPYTFTNYTMLSRTNAGYAFKALSYLPKQEVIWDEFYKPGGGRSSTPIRYILKNKALKIAYWLLITGLLLYIIFTAKRGQRIIPIITPLKNTLLEFTETVGRLYYHGRDHKDIMLKRYTYFLEYLRSKYFIHIKEINNENYGKIAEKTGVSLPTVKKLGKSYAFLKSRERIAEENLLNFNKTLEDFYKECV